MQHQPFTFRRCRRQRAQVIAGWSQTAVNDQYIGMFATLTQNGDQIVKIVTYRVATG